MSPTALQVPIDITTHKQLNSLTQSHVLLVPFEEDEKDPSVWFLDHNYIEGMNNMFKKVNGTPCFYIYIYIYILYHLTYFIYNSQRKDDRLVS